MVEAYVESRVRIELENLSFVITVSEAEDLFDQLQDALPDRGEVTRNNGGSFGFGTIPHDNDRDNDE
jgi:hypothetical protein